MKHLITTAAIAAVMATPAFAGDKDHDKKDAMIEASTKADARAYTDDHAWVDTEVFDANMDKVGDVERVSFDADGNVDKIVVETGGLLDLGGKEIELTGDQYQLVQDSPDEDASIQVAMSGDAFKSMPAFEAEKDMDWSMTSSAEYEPDYEAEKEMKAVAEDGFTDDHEWVDRVVYDSNMDKVGDVERVAFDETGEVNEIVVETGGVLEIGGKEIRIAADQYTLITAQGDEGDAEIQLTMERDTFKAMPEFIAEDAWNDEELNLGLTDEDETMEPSVELEADVDTQ